jgi:RNA-directed DNA polymerase
MDEDQIADVLKSERLGHDEPGMRGVYGHVSPATIHRRYCGGGWWPVTAEITLFNPAQVSTTRYRYRGAAIPAPWPASG